MTAPPEVAFPAQRFARALLSGEVGFALLDKLTADFPDIGRNDVFFGCTLALSEMHASLIASEYELRIARRQLEHREAA